jgi:hypothetical protein
MPRPLYPQGKSPWYPLDRRPSGVQSQCGHGKVKNSQPLQALKPLIIQPIAQCYTTELPGSKTNYKYTKNVSLFGRQKIKQDVKKRNVSQLYIRHANYNKF